MPVLLPQYFQIGTISIFIIFMRILIGFDAKDEKENNDRNVVAVFFKVAQGAPHARIRVETRNL
jgi:hypothetical protein